MTNLLQFTINVRKSHRYSHSMRFATGVRKSRVVRPNKSSDFLMQAAGAASKMQARNSTRLSTCLW
jgi:hypothetical protein